MYSTRDLLVWEECDCSDLVAKGGLVGLQRHCGRRREKQETDNKGRRRRKRRMHTET